MKKLTALALVMIILLSVTPVHAETTLTLWCIAVEGDSNRAAYLEGIAAIEAAHPGLHIKMETTENEAYKTKIRNAMSSGENLPDIFFTWTGLLEEFTSAGRVYSLDDSLPEYQDELSDVILANSTFNGKHYGVPLNMNVVTMFANMDMLKEVGYESVPDTADGLFALCEVLLNAGKIPFGVAGRENWCLSELIEPILAATIGTDELAKCYTDNASWNQSGVVNAMNKFTEMKKYIDPIANTLSNESVKNKFISGSYAFYMNGSWNCSDIADRAQFEVRACTFPVVDEEKSSSYKFIGGPNDTLAVSATSANPELASEVAFELGRIISREAFLNNYSMPAWTVNYDTTDCNYISTQLAELIAQSDGMVLYGDNYLNADSANTYLDYIAQIFAGDIIAEEFAAGLAENLGGEIIIGGSGTCGENATWVLDEEGTLTISGFGDMENYDEDPVGQWHYDQFGSVRTIIVEEGITGIGDYAFAYCRKATSIALPSTVTHIGTGAFCSTLISDITLPTNTESIGAYAFSNCENLITLSIPDTISEISDGLLEECYTLESVVFPGNLTTIGNYAFKNCYNLQSIEIPEGVTKIGDRAFANCISFDNILLPDSLTNIGTRAFADCTVLSEITIPADCTVGAGAFSGCSNLENIFVEPENKYYTSINGILFTKNMKTLVQYPAGRKDRCYIVPDGIIAIGAGAFSRNNNLQTIILPDDLVAIGKEAFWKCSYLSDISLPLSVQSISQLAFYDNPLLSNVYYGGTDIDRYMMSIEASNGSLDSAVWHYASSITTIASGSFGAELNWALNRNSTLVISGNGNMPDFDSEEPAPWYEYSDNIQAVILEDGVTSIGSSAFYEYKNLATVTMSDSITQIGSDAFLRCISLANLQLSNGLIEIGSTAFSECPRLTTVTLPGSLETLGLGAFASTNVSSIVIPAGTKTKAWDFFYPADDGLYLYHINLPDSITDAGYGAFCYTALPHDNPDFIMPDELKTIEPYAFSGVNARFVWLSDNVETIGAYAFADCDNLRYIYIPNGCGSIDPDAFPKGTKIIGISGYDNPCSAEVFANTYGYDYIDLEDPFGGNG